ncbi:DUF4344 domain-containing metallopeptidase [Nocardia sp. NPDC052566]|uniref:DUF4344 domain-containing metallopeptidase n=1 Tax=Nocardia sp. NPDC052566 TaxID=3364330 RepID=UPI0037C91117
MRKTITVVVAVACAALLLTGCGKTKAAKDAAPPAANSNKITVRYENPTKPEHQKYLNELKAKSLIDRETEYVNRELVFPINISFVTKECGVANAYWDGKSEMSLCYELLAKSEQDYKKWFPNDGADKLETYLESLVLDAYYHELAHALHQLYDLPVAGNAEDAADRLSAYMLTELEPDGVLLANVALHYHIEASHDTDIKQIAWYDEHPVNAQRALNYTCWVYGANPAKHAAALVGDQPGQLPQARAEKCEFEAATNAASWGKLLQPHLRVQK